MGAADRAGSLRHAGAGRAAGRGAARPSQRRARSGLSAFLADESGATAIEYGLIAGIISIVIISATTSIGGTLTGWAWDVVNGFS
nr:Flp family type IVb pilin [Marinicauda salina]